MSAPVRHPEQHQRPDESTPARHVYEPHRVGLPPLGSYVRELWRRREFARSLDPDMLLMWLAPTGQSDPAKLWLMAELLYLEGLQLKVSESGEWRGDLERALAILAAVPPEWRPGDALTDAGTRATEIRGLLEVSN